MNGVRRLLGAATGASPSPPDEDSPPVQTNFTTTVPLTAKNNAQAPNWLPSSSILSPKQTSFGESIQSTAAFFLGKKDKGRQASVEEEKTIGSPYSAIRPLNGLNSHTKSSSHEQIPSSSHTPRNGSSSDSPSPTLPSRVITRKSVNRSDAKRSSGFTNTRDELLFSLLASEAVVDSRGFAVLTSEEVEELKKEQHVLNARLVAAKKKLGLETKIRDAAISLSKVNASHKNVSRQTDRQLEGANTRVDAAQKDLWSISERTNAIYRRLMEHRAAVLSFSVRDMEKKISPTATSYDSGYDSNRSTILTPARTSTTGPSEPKFEGAHFFAGHSDAIIPQKRLSPEATAAEIANLEMKLKAATESLAAGGKQRLALVRELSLVRLEKQEVEAMRDLDLQASQETILALEEELPRLEKLDLERQSLLLEKEEWVRERSRLEERNRQVEILRNQIADLETRSGEAATERLLVEIREEYQRQLEGKEREIDELRRQWEMRQEGWKRERAEWEDDRSFQRLQEMEKVGGQDEDVLQHVSQELDDGLATLRQMIREHGVASVSRGSSLKDLLEALRSHLQVVHSQIEKYKHSEVDRSATIRKLEDEMKAEFAKREAFTKELESIKKDRDFVKTEARSLQDKHSSIVVPVKATLPEINVSADADVNQFISVLLPIWCILPSPEVRAAKFPRVYRTGSPFDRAHPSAGSLSELDVRSLKILYNGPGSPTATTGFVSNTFSIEAFAQRVQALIADDRALIERLIRFAQAHDLLKKNAERAQKLAQDGNTAMETYHRQVRILEERNQTLGLKMLDMQNESNLLREDIERLTVEKRQAELLVAEQAETCKQLSDANNTLSARTLTLAEEVTSAPETVRKHFEGQISELTTALEKAEVEIEEMKTSGQVQRAALFEEMNTMHEENANLRAQLRAARK